MDSHGRLLGLLLLFLFNTQVRSSKPHIVHMLADDFGWNDVGFRNPMQLTPFIDELAATGLRLERHYAFKYCSPTRSMLLTGTYTIHTGMWNNNIAPITAPYGVPLNFTYLPQYLKRAGYATHAVGKWHQGFVTEEYTPTRRGFDTYLGYYFGMEDHWTHAMYVQSGVDKGVVGIDLHNDTAGQPLKGYSGQNCTYSSDLYSQRAVEIIAAHDKTKPLFLYLPWQATHAPTEAPQKNIDRCKHVSWMHRRLFCGMANALDEGVQRVIEALKQHQLWDNTLLVFHSDNGGQLQDGGNNYPLRGGKFTYWEGGVRVNTVVNGGLLPQHRRGLLSHKLIHVTDWLPTYCFLAGVQGCDTLDGFNQWEAIVSANTTSPRTEVVHNIDCGGRGLDCPPDQRQGALMQFPYKLIFGSAGSRSESTHWKVPTGHDPHADKYHPGHCGNYTGSDISDHLVKSNFTCTLQKPCLFNVMEDPNENNNLATQMPDKVKVLKNRLLELAKHMHPNIVKPDDPTAVTKMHQSGGYWLPWKK